MPKWITRVPWAAWALLGAAWIGLQIWELSQRTTLSDRVSDLIGVLVGIFVISAALGLVRPLQARGHDHEDEGG
ncbi:hypothetical protein ACIBH1_20720 [Nonomuraea sp. NPDC050663]|uniref:hypothetical protein n=1 Tax=Nonomuraea sp. NPDC050663 TaxID=3364370 RepID=UPI0037902784